MVSKRFVVYGCNSCKHIIKDNVELRGDGLIMKVKYENHYGRVKTDKTKEEPTTTKIFPFGDMRTPLRKLMF